MYIVWYTLFSAMRVLQAVQNTSPFIPDFEVSTFVFLSLIIHKHLQFGECSVFHESFPESHIYGQS